MKNELLYVFKGKVVQHMLMWISEHRYILGMLPKDWTKGKEIEYLKWSLTQKDTPSYCIRNKLDV